MLALVAGCGSLPRPFEGNPGATAARLSQPPPSRLAVPQPGSAFLAPAAASMFATNLAGALADQEVPAVADAPRKGDWRVLASAEPQGNMIVPQYVVEDEKGIEQGTVEGVPISASAWIQADPPLLQQAATDAAPRLASLLTRIDAARRQSDPNSLLNRPSKLGFLGVDGAPGDGNSSLARQMRAELPKLGQIVQDTAQGADFTLEGHVVTAPLPAGQMRVEIQWVVSDSKGAERGRVIQLNEVKVGSLDHFWGDVAMVVAQEAAGGVRDVIMTQTGNKQAAVGGPAAAKP
jgi:hypothetical protein